MDPIQYPHFANKLGEEAYRRIVGCGFSKIFKNKGLKIFANFLEQWGVYRENYYCGNKKAGGALRPAGLNFKCQLTNSYLLEP